MNQNNAQFYVKKNYLNKKIGKIKRDLKANSCALVSILKNDYSSKKLAINWNDKPTRFDLINKLIADHKYDNYLEIGCSRDDCFQAITSKNKIGVDPFHGGTHRMTSDDFFASNKQKFDIIFIDGLHQYEQVKRDMLNGVTALNDGGIILVHDCLPLNYFAQLPFPPGGDWNGDVWKAFVELRSMDNIDCAVSLIDHGVGVIKKRSNKNPLNLSTTDFFGLKFKDFVNNYESWLNTISYEATLKFAGN
jgi:Methyltransferase domain